MYMCVCVCASAFCMEETKLTDENEYEKRYERGVIGSTASNLKGEGLDLIDLQEDGWFFWKKSVIFYIYRQCVKIVCRY